MRLGELLEKVKNPLAVMIGVEVLVVALMMFGFLPREAALFLLGIFAFFVMFSPFKQAVLFAVFSIPLYTALPISESFDSMAAWRVIIAILFMRVLWERNSWILSFVSFSPVQRLAPRLGLFRSAKGGDHAETVLKSAKRQYPRIPLMGLGGLVGLFLALGVLSLLVAQEPIFGIKKLLYLANIFALFFVVQSAIKRREDFVSVLRYTFSGAILTLAVGYAQFITILFIPLYTFWQWWASHVIPVFYGANLGNLLSYSNTWFSYYEEAEATLRVFSLFPDSHSSALFMVLTLPMALTFFMVSKKGARLALGAFIILALLAIIFSGTRGIWMGAVPVFLILLLVWGIPKKFFFLSPPFHKFLNDPVASPKGLLFNHQSILSESLGKTGSPKSEKKLFGIPQLPSTLKYFSLIPASVIKVSITVFLLFIFLFPVSSQLLKFSQMRQGGIVSESNFERISTSFSMRELSNLGRIQIWKSTIESIAKKPILGVGMGNYPIVLNENISATKEGASAHSLYLDVISEMGILGGILLMLIFITILAKAIRVFIKSNDPMLSAFAGFFAVYFLWVMTYSAVDVVLLNDKVLLLFVVLVALLYAVPREKYIKN